MPSVGGAARRATLIRHLKAQIHNPVLLIDSGDIATRGPLATTYEGVADIAAMNAVGYDMAAIGNNEFKLKDGVDQFDADGAQSDLLQIIKLSRFPWICANALNASGDTLQGVQPYIVRVIGGVRVGFLGLTAPRSAGYPQTQGWHIGDPVAAAKQWIPEARRHCDILIAVTHIGFDLDKQLAAQTSGIDAIVGGDSHTYLYHQVVVKNAGGVMVPIVQDGEFGVRLGRLDLLFRSVEDPTGMRGKIWTLAKSQDALIPVSAAIPEAPDVAAVIRPFTAPLVNDKLGRLPFGIATTPTARLTQTNQLIASAMRAETGADLGLSTTTTGLYNVFRHRIATRYDVLAILPFHDEVSIATLTGAQIRRILQSDKGSQIAGDAASLVDDQTYRVALLDFIRHGVYKLPATVAVSTGRDVRLVVAAYIRQPVKVSALPSAATH